MNTNQQIKDLEEWYEKTMKKYPPFGNDEVCAICGKKDANNKAGVCLACEEKLSVFIRKQFILSKKNQDKYCKKCWKHIKACGCPRTKALKNLEQ